MKDREIIEKFWARLNHNMWFVRNLDCEEGYAFRVLARYARWLQKVEDEKARVSYWRFYG